jgi:cysteinyl-tRNA synthetase
LQASEKGLKKLMEGIKTLNKIKSSSETTVDIKKLSDDCYNAMNDDFNSPMVISTLFEAVRIVNSANDGKEKLTAKDIESLKRLFDDFVFNILGLRDESADSGNNSIDGLMELILSLRQNAKTNKDFATSDKIRDELLKIGISVKDTKDGAVWSLE